MKKDKGISLWVLVMFLLFVNSVSAVPGDWWGTVKINNQYTADGSVVTAYINENSNPAANAVVGSLLSNYYLVHVEANTGDSITFKVNNISVEQSAQPWSDGDHELNLSIAIGGQTTTPSGGGPGGVAQVGNTTTTTETCPVIACVWDPCPNQHLPDDNGCINCASPCPTTSSTTISNIPTTTTTTTPSATNQITGFITLASTPLGIGAIVSIIAVIAILIFVFKIKPRIEIKRKE